MRFRLDRFLTLRFAHPLVRVSEKYRRKAVPILMYHSISEDITGNSHPYYEINTSPAAFASHMSYLRDNEYSTIGFRELEERIPGNDAKNSVMITFDDGYADFFEEAAPILEKFGFQAVVFLATGSIGKNRSDVFHGKKMLRWSDVRSLRKSGTSFGAHTVNHTVLKDLKRSEMESELFQSKMQIEDQLGESIDAFSCPYAFPQEDRIFQSRYFSVLKEAGYRYGVTTIIGRFSCGDDILRIRRLPINRYDDRNLFVAKIEGGYDWLAGFQYLHRNTTVRMKNAFRNSG